MNTRVATWNRTISGTLAVAAVGVLLAVFAALVAAPGVVDAQVVPTNCIEAMDTASDYLDLRFTATMTETKTGLPVSAGQVLCVQTEYTATIGFKGTSAFFVNGNHLPGFQVVSTTEVRDFADVLPGYATFLVTGSSVDSLVNLVNPQTNTVVDLYVGSLKLPVASTTVPATPTPEPSQPWKYVQLPYRVDYTDGPPTFEFMEDGTTSFQLHGTTVFTLTEVASGETYSSTADLNGGFVIFVQDIEDGKWVAPALKGLWWSARFDAVTPDTVFRMHAPKVSTTTPATTTTTNATGKVQYKKSTGELFSTADCTGVPVLRDPAATIRICGGARGKIAGAPSVPRPLWLPLTRR
ncbi:hypothetical protein KBB12_03115 [Candidatus Woesebacteria bacterium]|nr:hypothetical protein [Candidatus Woesebacteria bacterium]